MNKSIKIISEVEVFNKAIFRVIEAHLQYERYDGTMSDEIVRLNLDRGDSVATLVHDTNDDVLIMTEQFRYPTLKKGPGWMTEIPAGVVEAGQPEMDVMAREIYEEIGYRITSAEHIGTFYMSPGGTSERIHLYYSKVDDSNKVSGGGGLASEEEDIRVLKVPVKNALDQLNNGQILDAKTAIALQWFALSRKSF